MTFPEHFHEDSTKFLDIFLDISGKLRQSPGHFHRPFSRFPKNSEDFSRNYREIVRTFSGKIQLIVWNFEAICGKSHFQKIRTFPGISWEFAGRFPAQQKTKKTNKKNIPGIPANWPEDSGNLHWTFPGNFKRFRDNSSTCTENIDPAGPWTGQGVENRSF